VQTSQTYEGLSQSGRVSQRGQEGLDAVAGTLAEPRCFCCRCCCCCCWCCSRSSMAPITSRGIMTLTHRCVRGRSPVFTHMARLSTGSATEMLARSMASWPSPGRRLVLSLPRVACSHGAWHSPHLADRPPEHAGPSAAAAHWSYWLPAVRRRCGAWELLLSAILPCPTAARD
jgi:hypothetical protein